MGIMQVIVQQDCLCTGAGTCHLDHMFRPTARFDVGDICEVVGGAPASQFSARGYDSTTRHELCGIKVSPCFGRARQ